MAMVKKKSMVVTLFLALPILLSVFVFPMTRTAMAGSETSPLTALCVSTASYTATVEGETFIVELKNINALRLMGFDLKLRI